MNLLAVWKKVLLFGLFGAVGCLTGWAVGEGYLAAARASVSSESVSAGTLITNPNAGTEGPAPSREFMERLDREKAKTGDVQISLIWFNKNDLDLHCVHKDGPRESRIFFKQRRSPNGGELDVDANAEGSLLTSEPVENIYWPAGGAPPGKYTVQINHYRHRADAGAPNETQYKVSVLFDGKREEFAGTITNNGTNENFRTILEFQLQPRVEVYAPPEISVNRGGTLSVPVAVRRFHAPGKLELTAENLSEGVTVKKAEIPDGKDEGELQLTATPTAAEGKKPVKVVATGSGATGSFDASLAVELPRFSFLWVILIGVWTALLAVGLCLALLAGQNRYLHRPLFAAGRIPLAGVILGAVAAGFVSGSVGQSLYSLLLSAGAGGLGFVIGWVLLGGLLGWGVSFFVANLDKKRAALAGLAGGLLGAVAYLVWSNAADWLGRFAGAAVLGFCIGLVVAVVEAAFRRAWLEVRYGERETIHVNLGPEPVKVGGDARLCTVWARGAADVALRFFVRNSQVVCEDTPTRAESVVGEGHTRSVGTVTLTVRTGATAVPMPPAPPRPPTPRVPPPPISPGTPTPMPPLAGLPTLPSAPTPMPTGGLTPPTPPTKAPPPDFDDGLPMPMSPPPPARPAAKSILDDEGYSPPARPAAPSPAKPPVPPAAGAKPPAPVPPKAATPPKPPAPAPPAAARPPVPGAVAKPPVPAAPPKPAAPPPSAGPPAPAAGAKPAGEACPTCGRTAPGRPGARYCMMCDKSY